jgi:hypothetical protein
VTRPRLTYANVTSTLALFVALGGAGYAAVTLPANSVGPAQLRTGAVGTRALGFPLGTEAVFDNTSRPLERNGCDQPTAPGEPAPPCVPEPRRRTPTFREVVLHLHARATLMISAVSAAYLPQLGDVVHPLAGGATGSPTAGGATPTAQVTVHLDVDGEPFADASVGLVAGQQVQVPVQYLAYLRRGTHTVGIDAEAHYPTRGAGTATVGPVSIIVTELPWPN